MAGIDFNQIPNLAQVFTVALLPLLFLALGLLGLIFALWLKTRLLQTRIDALAADLKMVGEKIRGPIP
jgi:hypothetical protein